MNKYELRARGLLALPLTAEPGLSFSGISDLAEFAGDLTLGSHVTIEMAVIGPDCTFEEGVYVGDKVHIGGGTLLERAVRIGKQTIIMNNCIIGQSSEIEDRGIIGDHINLPQEVQIGAGMVVPSQNTIMALGRFGTSRRVVTIHGSDDGPRFSIGCQFSVSEATITHRIMSGVETSPRSAAHYRAYLSEFSAIGARVQQFYDQESRHIEDLRGIAEEFRRRNT